MDKSLVIESLCIILWTKQTYKSCGYYRLKMNLISVRGGPGLPRKITLSVWDSLLGQQMLYSEFILTYGQ